MARYLCQICYRIVPYGENHSCLFYKDNDYVYTLPKLEELDKIDKNNDYAKDIVKENLNDIDENLQLEVRQIYSENSAVINTSLKENIDEVFLVSDSRRKRKLKAISNRAQMRNRCGTSIACTETTDNTGSVYEQNNGESKVSHLSPGKAYEECRMSLQDSKWQPFNNDKDSFMDSLDCVIKSDHSVKKNITGSKNSLFNYGFLQGNKKTKLSTIEASRSLKNEHISPEMTSEDSNHIHKMAANEEESICFIKDDIAVAGPSGIRPLKKKFVCHICSKRFQRKCNLQEHYRIHTGEKPFQCRICKSLFARKTNLTQHYKIHSGRKTIVCDICGRDFNFKKNLQKHYRTHTGEKPFVCDVCQKAFAQACNLKTHIRTHTGVKPYKCPACEKSFTNNRSCSKHHKRMHE
ncbi:Zinc finger protein 69 like protein [Argiope bruennichi]|uniref:Zinc finger protein 69 like protein n=1 Tax=Argiope bruennichi TaxID=94029 RepID=A0A8T0FAH9_ARGBR|nr:Zinc finger protein 69 like protein [Argiope bruennichi]